MCVNFPLSMCKDEAVTTNTQTDMKMTITFWHQEDIHSGLNARGQVSITTL